MTKNGCLSLILVCISSISLYIYALYITSTPIRLNYPGLTLVVNILILLVIVLWVMYRLDLFPKRPFFTPLLTVKSICLDIIGYAFSCLVYCSFIFMFAMMNESITSGLYTLAFGTYESKSTNKVVHIYKERAKTHDGFAYYISLDDGRTRDLDVTKEFFVQVDEGNSLVIKPLCSPLACFVYEENIEIVK